MALELAFSEQRLRRICESETTAKRILGPTVAAALTARVADLLASETVADFPFKLVADDSARPVSLLLLLADGYQLRFRSNHQAHQSINGPPDWNAVRRIQITAIARLQ